MPRKNRGLLTQRAVEIETLPSGKLDTRAIFGMPEGMPVRPAWLCCDCCLSKTMSLLVRRHYGFCVDPHDGLPRLEFYEGAWAFCTECVALLTRLDMLVARAVLLTGAGQHVTKLTFATMLRCLYGQPWWWKAGDPPIGVTPP